MLKAVFILLLAGLCVVAGQERKPDPRCIQKKCTSGTACRFVKSCPSGQACKLEAQCLTNYPEDIEKGRCLVGNPVLVYQDGGFRDLTCGLSSLCPKGAYCNTELKDIYSVCCMSDPEAPVKPWTCPANTFTGDDFCLDTCINDGDCRFNQKCCKYGCNWDCLHQPHICDTKQCPPGSFCHRKSMLFCTPPRQCPKEGDCVDCPPPCETTCKYGHVLDFVGCPTCFCKIPPTTTTEPTLLKSRNLNTGVRPGMSWLDFILRSLWVILLIEF